MSSDNPEDEMGRWDTVKSSLGSDFAKFIIPFLSIFVAFVMFPLIQPPLYNILTYLFVYVLKSGVESTFILIIPLALIFFAQTGIAISVLIVIVVVGGVSLLAVIIAYYLIGILDKKIQRSRMQIYTNHILKIIGIVFGIFIILKIVPSNFMAIVGEGVINVVILSFIYFLTIIVMKSTFYVSPTDPIIQLTFSGVMVFATDMLYLFLFSAIVLLCSMYFLQIFNDLLFSIDRALKGEKLREVPESYEWMEKRIEE